MKIITLTFLLCVSMTANAFYSVTEILPNGELLICKNVEIRKKEISLPAVGSKIGLFHKDFNTKRKTSKDIFGAKIGNATIVESKSLTGVDKDCVVAIADNGLVVDELAAVDW